METGPTVPGTLGRWESGTPVEEVGELFLLQVTAAFLQKFLQLTQGHEAARLGSVQLAERFADFATMLLELIPERKARLRDTAGSSQASKPWC